MDICNIIVSIISVLLSGVLSWFVTFLYFKKTNRNEALSIIIPKIYVLNNQCIHEHSDEDYRKIVQLYQLKYLHQLEKECIIKIYRNCYVVCMQPKSYCMAISVKDYFVKDNGSEPAVLLGEKLGVADATFDVLEYGDLREILDNVFRKYIKYQYERYYENDITVTIEDDINNTLNKYFFGEKKYNFFENQSLVDVLTNGWSMKVYNDALDRLFESYKDFEEVFDKELAYTLNSSIYESERIY